MVVETEAKKITTGASGDPKTPMIDSRWNSRLNPETTELRSRRRREKQIIQSNLHSPLLEREKSHINFKISGSPPKKEIENEKANAKKKTMSPPNNISTSAKLRRSFSPSRLEIRLPSPLMLRKPLICISPTRSRVATL
ncbi:unnamed protein product [Lactuca saligna]|uniref:Uncharacterized protein n=1 Tax=Lactuca saligna TaxID=75948 RepID=A0AA35ZFL1_LACSI|nr:unnamed protein product [Lactuca saligna]